MSRSDSDAAQAPERRSSSSALLDAFRTLTSGRVQNATPTSPSSTATLAHSPGEMSSVDDLKSKKERGKTSGVDASPLDLREDSSTAADDDGISAVKILGGPPGLQRLLRQLGPSQSGQDRIEAAKEISLLLEEYPIQNIIAIWDVGKSLIQEGKPEKELLAGYDLLRACINRSGLTGYERWTFYSSIFLPQTMTNLDRRLEALKHLTEQGRNIEGIESQIPSSLALTLENSFQKTLAEREERKLNKRSQASMESKRNSATQPPPKEEKNLFSLFEYIMEVTKYNAKSFQDEDVTALLNALLNICKQARTRNDIAKCLEVMTALMTRFYIAAPTLTRCLEVLCDIVHQLEDLRDAAYGVVKSMLCSHLGRAVILALLDLVRQSPQSGLGITSLLGAIFVLRRITLTESESDFPAVPLTPLLNSLRCSLAFKRSSKVVLLEADVLGFVNDLIDDPAVVDILVEEQDLTDLLVIVETCLNNHSSRLRARVDLPAATERHPSPHSSISSSITASDNLVSKTSDPYDRAVASLLALSAKMDMPLERNVVDLFLNMDYTHFSAGASQFLADHFLGENLLSHSREDWFGDTRRVVELILKDQSKPTEIRVRTVQTLKKAYGIIEGVAAPETSTKFATLIIEAIVKESDTTVQGALLDFTVSIAEHSSNALFQTILGSLEASIIPKRPSSYIQPTPDSPPFSGGPRILSPLSRINTECVVRLFLLHLNHSAARAHILYELLLRIAENADCEADARVTALKLLFRLRSDASHHIFVISSAESETLAASLCRTVETAAKLQTSMDESSQRVSQVMGGEPGSSAMPRITSGSTRLSRSKLGRRPASTPIARASRPAWMYPGPKGLPEEPPSDPSPVLFSSPGYDDESGTSHREILETGRLLELVISILQQSADWEAFSYIIVHIGAQLTNRPLFHEAIPQIKHLRNVVCEQVRNQTFHEPPTDTGLKKSNVAICIFHILTMLISYHDHFGKSEQDEIVKMFVLGVGAREPTARDCIHALSVCCYELPGSVVKSMDQILHKMSQVITQSHIAVDILEFLAAVARLPDLFRNFRDEDYKMVLGICFRYLQSIRDLKDRAAPQTPVRMSQSSILRHSGSSREFAAITEQEDYGKHPAYDLPQYVYALAFHVITFWFMSMKIQDRPKHLPYITANLTYTDQLGRTVVEEQGQVTMDLIERIAYSDRDETTPAPDFVKERDGEVSQRTWLIGHSLLTVETAGRSGLSRITRRRPSSTRHSLYTPQLVNRPRHQVPLAHGSSADIYHTSDFVGIYPEDVMQEYYSPLSIASHGSLTEQPVLLRDEEAVNRALSSFDRISALDGHKIGILFVDTAQTQEKEIMGNMNGSSDYTAFIDRLGTLTRLHASSMNMQGLDRHTGTDGEYTYCWRDRVTEIVYHIITMMPTYSEDDPRYHQKKMHIGNDFVNIVWNNSGHAFHVNTIPSQVTMVYIVITPEALTSFRHDSKNGFYKVKVLTKPGFPSISPAAETKVVSGHALPSFIRLLALNASVFSNVWVARDPSGGPHDTYVSSWRARLQVIKRLHERYAPQEGGARASIASSIWGPPGELNEG